LARAAQWVRRRDFAASARHVARALDLVRRKSDAPEALRLGAQLCRERLALGIRVALGPDEAARIFAEGLAWAEHLAAPLVVGGMHQAMSVLSTCGWIRRCAMRRNGSALPARAPIPRCARTLIGRHCFHSD
jgi:hypothetical protein